MLFIIRLSSNTSSKSYLKLHGNDVLAEIELKGATSMQVITDLTLYSGIAASVLAASLAVYLIVLWFRQENRLLTDLPLMFGIVFIAHASNQFIVLLSESGILEMTLEVFKIRALVVGGIALPLVGVLLHIWLPRIRRHHMRILGFVTLYWVIVVMFGFTQNMIMILHLPVIIIFMGGMVLTFAITWKTGRLKEVRSDLMVFSAILSLIGQMSLVALLSMGLVAVWSILTVVATLFATLALVNPWYKDARVI